MKDNKLPHFPFFARDWLTDTRVMLMDLATQGAYIKLLCYQWLEGGIPRDEKQLATLCGTTEETFVQIWLELNDAFEVNGDGKLVNPRLEAIRGETEAKVAKAIENGKKGAAKRWKNSDPIATPLPDHSDPNTIHIHSHSHSQEEDGSRPEPESADPFTQETAEVHEALMLRFRFGHLKALDMVQNIGTTLEDLRDWERYEEAKGTRLAKFQMKTFKNPRDIPPEKKGTETTETTNRKTFAQMDADEYAAKKAEFEKEKGDSDVSGNSESA